MNLQVVCIHIKGFRSVMAAYCVSSLEIQEVWMPNTATKSPEISLGIPALALVCAVLHSATMAL